ncbi:LOW QUALITY PROTEIN: pectinesterase inhibitor 5 [Euphorbia lathyris]|uniref:LOW QUALITY PROTEIN: pectinesterase inhibitor 5 n=1 Tax=Euphorbia lathyris TaxID=212925 RepID=UPI003313900E
MGSLNHPLISLILLLLTFSLVLETKGDKDLVENICKQSQDYNFCISTMDRDNRRTITDPVGKTRVDICQLDYEFAILRFAEGVRSAIQRSYGDVIDDVRDGTNKVIDCENSYRMSDPIAVSPLTVDNHNVFKFSEIIFIIVDSILVPH